ncbi:MAG TPA: lauroyl acyltransferase [Acetobacteraceae bacterium]|nr:lauroyl acyltransferase [Acetobacteraceae bacterium]
MKLRYRIEAAAVRAGLALIGMLSPAAASNLGGAVARTLGPLLPVSKVADENIRHAYPELDAAARRRLVRGVWENLGRTVAELPHLGKLEFNESGPGWEAEGGEHALALVERGGPAVLISAHIGNWELLPVAFRKLGVNMAVFFRRAANPLVDRVITDLRTRAVGQEVPMFNKGAAGAIQALAHLARGGYLGILQDQKMNEGVAVPLFGRPAMTAIAAATYALRFKCPVVVGHVRRLGPARLRIVIGPPLELPDTGNRRADIIAFTATINAELEARIRSWPEGWLWLHRRWPKDG